jgi:hypothetical protein
LVIIIIFIGIMCETKLENFYYESPPIAYNQSSCNRMCDNSPYCESSWYDPASRQCWMNTKYRYGDLYYPYVNNTYLWYPSKFGYGKYFRDVNSKFRPSAMRTYK